MSQLSDSEFCACLDTLQGGGALPADLPAGDAADLAFASHLLGLPLTPSAGRLSATQIMEAVDQGAVAGRQLNQPAKRLRWPQPLRRFTHAPDGRAAMAPAPTSAGRRLVLGLGALAVILMLFIAAYAPARAMAAQLIQKITFGRITVLVGDTPAPIPTSGLPEDNYSTLWTPTTLAAIQSQYPVLASLPGWAPPGYIRQARVALYYHDSFGPDPDYAIYEWKDNRDDAIQLTIWTAACYHGSDYDPTVGCNWRSYISADPAHPVVLRKMNGQTAALLPGRPFRADFSGSARQWNPTHYRRNPDGPNGLALTWEKGPAEYTLGASSADVSQADLIRMAESIP